MTQTTDQSSTPTPSVLVRVDSIALLTTNTDTDGTLYEVFPTETVTAAKTATVPIFENWAIRGMFIVRIRGQCTAPFDAMLDLSGNHVGSPQRAVVDGNGAFSLEFSVGISQLTFTKDNEALKLGIILSPEGRILNLTKLQLPRVRGPAPTMASFDIREVTDSLLFDAPERKLFDLQNPEEGFWLGTGLSRLTVKLAWSKGDSRLTNGSPAPPSPAWTLEQRCESFTLRHGLVNEFSAIIQQTDGPTQTESDKVSGTTSIAGLVLDTSHPGLRGKLPAAGYDLSLDLTATHHLQFQSFPAAKLIWKKAVSLRLRDPAPLLSSFKRLSAVGIDFGTSNTVAALTQKGLRSLLRLGATDSALNAAENPTCLLIEDHERLWKEMAVADTARRFPNVVGLVRGSHAAKAALSTDPTAVITELKILPQRVLQQDLAPLFRDRLRHADFVLDEPKVRALIRTYAYLLSRTINRPGQDVFLRYWLTYPAQFDDHTRALLEEEIRTGILLGIPEGIPSTEVSVEMRATEPEAYAAEVCPELINHPAIEPMVSKFNELRFAVFDMGGGTLDIACGRYRPATESEQASSGCSSVVETLQVGTIDGLGGEHLTHEIAWLTHQYDKHLPEMENKEVPMQRPQTVPENKLARFAHLYKRSIAGRQNAIRFEKQLKLEAFKFKRENDVAKVNSLLVSRLDGSEVPVESLASDLVGLRTRLSQHLEQRLEEGARLLASLLKSTPWGGSGNWQEQGVVVLLAGNASRSEYLEKVLGKALGVPTLKVWRPDSSATLQGVILYETVARTDRGIDVQGVTPKTAVALGALKIANREVHLVRAAQGFSYFVGDLKGFPPKFNALIPMGASPSNPAEWGPHYIDFGTWDANKPLRASMEFEPNKMTSNDPRLLAIPTGLPPGTTGRLYVCVISPQRLGLHLALPDGTHYVRTELNLAPYLS